MVAAGDEIYAEDINDLINGRDDQSVSIVTTGASPLVSATNTDTVITTRSHTFKAGYAYKIEWMWPAQASGGTSPFVAYTKIRRSSASGTEIRTTGGQPLVTTNVVDVSGFTIVKRTGATDTTQTIALVGGISTSGGPTSINMAALSNRPAILCIARIGTATQYSGALEVPTS